MAKRDRRPAPKEKPPAEETGTEGGRQSDKTTDAPHRLDRDHEHARPKDSGREGA